MTSAFVIALMLICGGGVFPPSAPREALLFLPDYVVSRDR